MNGQVFFIHLKHIDMTFSQKYGRTFHYPFSPGASNDDRINEDYWSDISKIGRIIHTEKLDGENNCLNSFGVFARSHAAPAVSQWTAALRQRWSLIRHDLGNYEIFGENLFAIHSIRYPEIEDHFFVFAVREHDQWLSWEETCFIAGAFDLAVVPLLETITSLPRKTDYERTITQLAAQQSVFGSVDVADQEPCSREGIVTRNMDAYSVHDFHRNVFKYVRQGHVKTSEHWTKSWERAPLKQEQK